MTKKNFEEENAPKSTASKVVQGSSPSTIRSKVFKIRVYIGIAISLLVVAILASLFLFSPKENKESNQASSSVSTTETTSQASTSQGKTDETDKDKQEEIQKLKNQLADLILRLLKQKHLLAS